MTAGRKNAGRIRGRRDGILYGRGRGGAARAPEPVRGKQLGRVGPGDGEALHEADDLPGKDDGEQGIAYAFQRNIGEGKGEYDKVAHKIGPAYVPARQMGYAHGKGVVSARSAAGTDAQPHAHPYEQRAQNGGRQRHGGQMRPEVGKTLKESVEQRKAAARHERIKDEVPSHELPAEKVAEGVHDEAGPGGRNVEPVLKQERGSQNAAFRHAGKGMYLIKAEGQNGAACKIHEAQPGRKRERHGNTPVAEKGMRLNAAGGKSGGQDDFGREPDGRNDRFLRRAERRHERRLRTGKAQRRPCAGHEKREALLSGSVPEASFKDGCASGVPPYLQRKGGKKHSDECSYRQYKAGRR